MRRLAITLSRKSLVTIYKCFVRPNSDYGDILYGKPKKELYEKRTIKS